MSDEMQGCPCDYDGPCRIHDIASADDLERSARPWRNHRLPAWADHLLKEATRALRAREEQVLRLIRERDAALAAAQRKKDGDR